MSRAFKSYQRAIRRLKREFGEDPESEEFDLHMLSEAKSGNPAAKQWCKAAGIRL
jgi:hypothetical protein